MRTIWLNIASALLWWYFGWRNASWLIPLSLVVLVYSFKHDWHVDAEAYRDALADTHGENDSD